jgi:hypothetical protein
MAEGTSLTLHSLHHSDEETVELRVKTVNDGWLVAHRSRASDREWYALLDTKTASVTDAQGAEIIPRPDSECWVLTKTLSHVTDATTELLAAQFSNIYL